MSASPSPSQARQARSEQPQKAAELANTLAEAYIQDQMRSKIEGVLAAREVLETRGFEAEIDADWAKSKEYGVTGVPTFVAGGRGVVGAQPYEALESLLKQVGAEAKGGG